VGKPATLRDNDIEILFPYKADEQAIDGWPPPFPPLIRIVHLHGRAADALNNIKGVSQVTPEFMKRLAAMEEDLTGSSHAKSKRVQVADCLLEFTSACRQNSILMRQISRTMSRLAGVRGTSFILLHFWFHTLIVMLRQPTLLHLFGGSIQQLFPNSWELPMPSAKTIADILAFSELINIKSFIKTPFTSQLMHIAACVFLAKAAAHSS
jgi:hypothetical protein